MLFREIDNMVILHHPNIIRLFEVVEDADRMHIVLEYAPGGELHQKLMNEGKLQEEHAKTLFSQIVAAVSHIVSKIRPRSSYRKFFSYDRWHPTCSILCFQNFKHF